MNDTGKFSRNQSGALLLGLLLFVSPANALDLSTVIVDSISAHPEVKEKIHVYRQILSDRDIAESGWRPSIDVDASTGLYSKIFMMA